jgi:hypothetical protein
MFTSTRLFILQRIELDRQRESRGYKFSETVTGESFEIHRNDLVVIHEPRNLHETGEKLIAPYRADYLKQVTPEFTPIVVPKMAYLPRAGPSL